MWSKYDRAQPLQSKHFSVEMADALSSRECLFFSATTLTSPICRRCRRRQQAVWKLQRIGTHGGGGGGGHVRVSAPLLTSRAQHACLPGNDHWVSLKLQTYRVVQKVSR